MSSKHLIIDPHLPLLWRDASTIQIGYPHGLIIPAAGNWQFPLLQALRCGVPRQQYENTARSCSAPMTEIYDFLQQLEPVMVTEPKQQQISLQVINNAVDAEDLQIAVRVLTEMGVDVCDDADTVFLIGTQIIQPKATAQLMASDIRHVPICFHPAGASIGPVITPGVSACLSCIAAHVCQQDSAWPYLTAQLATTTHCPPRIGVLIQSIAVAYALVTACDPTATQTQAIELDVQLRQSVTSHQPSEDCCCRFPGGTGTEVDPSEQFQPTRKTVRFPTHA